MSKNVFFKVLYTINQYFVQERAGDKIKMSISTTHRVRFM